MSKANWQPVVVIAGSTGLVGSMMIRVLAERNIRARYRYFNSKNEISVQKIKAAKPDFVLMALNAELSAKWTPIFVKHGAVVIDNSSRYRMDRDVPLVIPEVNPGDIFLPNERRPHKIIANPNCSTIIAVAALAPLDKRYKIRRIVYSTYQAVSGAGSNPKFAYPIANNVLPQIDEFVYNGNTKEEEKIINETKKILRKPEIAVSATCVRVPVSNCHSISVNVEFYEKPDIAEVKKILAAADGVVLTDDPSNNVYPVPSAADGRDEVFVGRVRLDTDRPNTINLWAVGDNLRKGAATNAVQILQILLKGKHNE
jgi:aspartate-semialdehyde dehydrogenase